MELAEKAALEQALVPYVRQTCIIMRRFECTDNVFMVRSRTIPLGPRLRTTLRLQLANPLDDQYVMLLMRMPPSRKPRNRICHQ